MLHYFLWLTIAGVCAVCGIVVKRRNENLGNGILAGSIFAAVVLIAVQIKFAVLDGGRSSIDRYHAVVAYAMGHALVPEVGNKSGTVYLLFPPAKKSNVDALDSLFNTFGRILAPWPQIKLKELNVSGASFSKRSPRAASESFEEALRQTGDALAVISFVGMPEHPESLSIFSAKKKVPIFVFDPAATANASWIPLLKSGKIQLVIATKPGAQSANQIIGPPEQIFGQLFLQATPSTADEIVAQLPQAGK